MDLRYLKGASPPNQISSRPNRKMYKLSLIYLILSIHIVRYTTEGSLGEKKKSWIQKSQLNTINYLNWSWKSFYAGLLRKLKKNQQQPIIIAQHPEVVEKIVIIDDRSCTSDRCKTCRNQCNGNDRCQSDCIGVEKCR